MSIGEVLAQLRPEFPDITISKLRFLEAEGLVEPYRAPSGYRRYTRDHLSRLRYVLAAQRDRYLPLRVIREQLSAYDRGEKVVGLSTLAAVVSGAAPPTTSTPARAERTVSGPLPATPAPPTATPGPLAATPGPLAAMPGPPPVLMPNGPATTPAAPQELSDARLTRSQLLERSGLDDAGLAELEQFGLLTAGPSGHYGAEALTIARIAGQLSEYGLEARHLRAYRATADREVGLLAQLVPPLARQAGGGRAQALQTVHELAALCAALHAALVRAGLRQVLGSATRSGITDFSRVPCRREGE